MSRRPMTSFRRPACRSTEGCRPSWAAACAPPIAATRTAMSSRSCSRATACRCRRLSRTPPPGRERQMTGTQAGSLLQLVEADNRYDIPHAELGQAQAAAANQRFQQRIGQIGLLGHQAESANVTQIRGVEDLVPLLFAHTTYKSYPESWLVRGKWDRMRRGVETGP